MNKRFNWNNKNIKESKKSLLLLSISQITITTTLTSKDRLVTTSNQILKISIYSTLTIILILIHFRCIKTRTIMKIRKINLNHLLLDTLHKRNGKYDHSLIISFPHIILSCHLFLLSFSTFFATF